MSTEEDYRASSVLSGFSFSSFFLTVAIYGVVLYSIYDVSDGDFSSFTWAIPLVAGAALLAGAGWIFSIAAMKKVFAGDTVAMMVVTLLAFLATAGVSVFAIFRILGI